MKQKRKGSIPIDILYLPALVLLTVFVIYPLISGVQISFTNWNGYSSKYKYVGLANYVKMFHDKMFYTALKNTFIYGVGSTTRDRVSSGHDRFPDHGLYFLLSSTV